MHRIRKLISTLRQEAPPTAKELARRKGLLDLARRLSATPPSAPGPFPSAEEMLREDRRR